MKNRLLGKNAPWFLGFGMLGLTIATQTFAGVYMFFYVDKLGISLLMFTIAKTVYMIWDAINDPLSGIISDRTRSKIGRRKFWLIISAPLFMLGFILIFSPPASLVASGNKIGLAWWLFLGLMVYETAAGLQWVNYETVYPEVYIGDKARSKGEMFKVMGEITGVLVSSTVGISLYYNLGATKMALILSGIYAVFMSVCIFNLSENPTHQEQPQIKFVKSFKETLSNKPFWAFNIANLLAQTVNATLAGLLLFYGKYCLHIDGDQVTVMMGVAFAPVIFLVSFWSYLINKIGAKKAWKISFLVYAGCLVPLLFAKTFLAGVLAAFCAGFGMAGYLITPGVMRGRIIDEDIKKYGERREGVITSIASFIRQISPIISAIIVLVMGLFTGYKSGEEPGSYPDITFRLLISVVPILLLISAFLVSQKCKGFDEETTVEITEIDEVIR